MLNRKCLLFEMSKVKKIVLKLIIRRSAPENRRSPNSKTPPAPAHYPNIGHLAKWSVSSYKFGFGPECLTDGDPETFWQLVPK